MPTGQGTGKLQDPGRETGLKNLLVPWEYKLTNS